MKKIKFSHEYKKILVANGFLYRATLLEMLEVDLKDLHKPFLDYDTDEGKFELPKSGKYLLLIFHGYYGIFTTLRPAFPKSKVDYYKNSIGETFQVVVQEDAKNETKDTKLDDLLNKDQRVTISGF